MRLKTSALASHQTLVVISSTYIELGIHWRKHRMKPIKEQFWFTNPGIKSKIRVAIPTHRKCFPEDYNYGLRCTCIVSHQIRTRLLVNINLYLVWTMRMHCDHFRHTIELTGAWSEFPAVKQRVGMHGSNCWQMLKHTLVIYIQNTASHPK